MKNCKHCNAEFQQKHATRGHEQIYCSQKCAQQAARIRRENKLKNEAISAQKIGENSDEVRHVAQRSMGGAAPDGRVHSDGSLVYLEKLYEAKNENNYLKMQVEKLTEDLKIEKEKNYRLEIELEELEDPDQEAGGMIGQVMSQFQKDPVNTITFAGALLKNLFNAKATATQKSS